MAGGVCGAVPDVGPYLPPGRGGHPPPSSPGHFKHFVSGFRIRIDWTCPAVTFWYGSGSRTADPCLRLMDPDPANFIIALQDANKKQVHIRIRIDRAFLQRLQCCGSVTFWYRSGTADPCL